jgi:hypothetical protein
MVSMALPVMAMRFGLFHFTGYDLFWQAGGVIGCILLVVGFMSTKDPYGVYHLSLNVRPDADSSVGPDTEWLNMGYWKVNHASAAQGAC